ncbi:MAG TPA: CPBP family intramembrane glutamic endopeptidase [Thermoanaerobaculia bacterium]
MLLSRLSPRAELILINLICFGPLAWISISRMLSRETVLLYDARRLYTIAGIELVAGAIAILILRARGWKRSDFGLRISMPLTIGGMVLFIGLNIAIATFYEAFRAISGIDPASATTPLIRTTWLSFLLLLLVDPFFEEFFIVAYNIKATEANGAAFAITLSAVIRLICHLYQGPIAALTILPLGIVFAAVYWKWRRLWPLIVAHAVAGYFGLNPNSTLG